MSGMKKMKKSPWVWNGWDEEQIGIVVSQMMVYSPKTKESTCRKIALKWLRDVPVQIMKWQLTEKDWLSHVGLDFIRENMITNKTANTKKEYWVYWLRKNFPLWKVVTTGNNLEQKASEVMLRFEIEKVIDILSNEEVKEIYEDDVKKKIESDPSVSRYNEEWIEIDMKNLDTYIRQTSQSVIMQSRDKLKKTMLKNLTQAKMIQKLTYAYDNNAKCPLTGKDIWFCPQFYYHHPSMNRKYFITRFNLQACHKRVREAALGPRVKEYDLRTSVFAFYKMLGETLMVNTSIITEYMSNKTLFRNQIADVLQNTHENKRLIKVKQGLTAIGFGADNNGFGAIGDIMKNKEDTEAFNNHPKVIELTHVFKTIISQLKTLKENDMMDALAPEYSTPFNDKSFYDKRNRFNWERYMAYLYNTYETMVMEDIIKQLPEMDSKCILHIHDAVYVKGTVRGIDIQNILEKHNPYAKIDVSEIEKEVFTAPADQDNYDQAYREHKIKEQLRAQEWAKIDRPVSEKLAFTPMLNNNETWEDKCIQPHYDGTETPDYDYKAEFYQDDEDYGDYYK